MNRLVVITGTSRGLGLVLSKEFVTHDWVTIGTGRSAKPADLHKDVVYQQFDAGNIEDCQDFWLKIHEENKTSEICLINNAGGYVSGSLMDTKAEDYEQQMRSIYFTAVYMTKALAAVVPKAKIINIISTSALEAHKNNSAYGAAKAAEKHFFQALQEEFEPTKYQITNLYPSDIATHGPNDKAMSPEDLSIFVRELAKSDSSLYLRDATIYSVT